MTWLHMAQPVPVTYAKQQYEMQLPILGIVLHTTNSKTRSLVGQQKDWQSIGRQSAHFAIDRTGKIGQYRSTSSVAWHIGKLSTRYFGIEHIAHHNEELTDTQIEASAQLVACLCDAFGIPIQRMEQPGGPGVAIHPQFHSTSCGQTAFWTGHKDIASTFDDLLARAKTYSEYGLYDYATRTGVTAADGRGG